MLTASDLAGHLPRIGATRPIGKRIVVAWNGSAEASHTNAAALPLLQHASAVEVVVCNPARSARIHGEEPGADLGQYLSRQEIGINVKCVQTDDDVGVVLHQAAHANHADLIVAGTYGH